MDKTLDIFLRYLIIVILGLGNLFLIYKMFTPLTVYSTALLLKLFSPTLLFGNIIYFSNIVIEIIPACIAGSAYYLILILNLSTPKIKFSKRIKIIFFSLFIFLVFNVLRIIFLAIIAKTVYFNFAHILFWYIISTLFVLGIWIFTIKFHNIEEIPVYSDLKHLNSLTKSVKKFQSIKRKQKNKKTSK